ncbi:unnamed protein product [Lampetra planeri]
MEVNATGPGRSSSAAFSTHDDDDGDEEFSTHDDDDDEEEFSIMCFYFSVWISHGELSLLRALIARALRAGGRREPAPTPTSTRLLLVAVVRGSAGVEERPEEATPRTRQGEEEARASDTSGAFGIARGVGIRESAGSLIGIGNDFV